MKSQDLITIFFTFLCGFVAGGYLYVIGFAPQMAKVSAELAIEPSPEEIITIEGRMYGGCERTGSCASFMIEDNGEYSYLATSVPTARGPYGGALSRKDWRDIRATLNDEDLLSSSRGSGADNCASYYDLVDYSYTVTYKGTEYTIDTCGTAIDRESDLGQTLDWLWQFFASDISV